MKKLNQSGFGIVEGLLIVAIIAILGLFGWYVWSSRDSDDSADETSSSTSTAEETPAEKEVEADETAGWLTFTPDSGLYSVRIPDGWTFDHQDDDCDCLMSQSSEYYPGTPATIRKVQGGRDGILGYFIVADDTDKSAERFEGKTPIGTFTTSSGLEGNKYKTSYTEVQEGIGPEQGSVEYNYYFVKDGRGIYIHYIVSPGETDQVELVEKSIRTLQ